MSCRTTQRHPSLIGADFDDVRARFGVPLACAGAGGVLQFAYAGDRGVVDDAVVVVDGVVVCIHPDIRRTPEVHGAKAYVGAHVEAAVQRFGPVRRVTVGTASSEIEFDGVVVTVYDDRIVGVRVIAPLTA